MRHATAGDDEASDHRRACRREVGDNVAVEGDFADGRARVLLEELYAAACEPCASPCDVPRNLQTGRTEQDIHHFSKRLHESSRVVWRARTVLDCLEVIQRAQHRAGEVAQQPLTRQRPPFVSQYCGRSDSSLASQLVPPIR